VGECPHSGFSPSDHTKQSTALFRAPTTWTLHLANQREALSHALRAGSVYKAAVWSTWDSVLDASFSCGCNGVTIASKISTDQAAIQPADR
jgi:hypothetical protein